MIVSPEVADLLRLKALRVRRVFILMGLLLLLLLIELILFQLFRVFILLIFLLEVSTRYKIKLIVCGYAVLCLLIMNLLFIVPLYLNLALFYRPFPNFSESTGSL